jgi:hypothetical protein
VSPIYSNFYITFKSNFNLILIQFIDDLPQFSSNIMYLQRNLQTFLPSFVQLDDSEYQSDRNDSSLNDE